MQKPTICGTNTNNSDCLKCTKAVSNAILYTSLPRGYHRPAQKVEENTLIFLLKGEALVNSQEYAGTMLHGGEFILQAIGSKYEMLALTDIECVSVSFEKPMFFCEERYEHIVKTTTPPLIFSPLIIKSELKLLLQASKFYLGEKMICKELLAFKLKELSFVLSHCYTDYELSAIVHSLAKYTNSFQFFVLKNHRKVKTVEELAALGGYTATTFRRIFTSVFHKPVYEWMQEQRKEGIVYDLKNTDISISEICYKYGFESLPHFSNYCKKNLGASPRQYRANQVKQ